MTQEEILIHNEQIRYRLVFEMLDQIEGVQFLTDEGKLLHNDLVEAIKIIRPVIIKSAKNLIK